MSLTPQQSLDLALDYIALNPGRYIFPIARGKKFPPLIKNNLADATNSETQIKLWCAKWPGCNWALSHKKSNVLVVDVDTKPGKSGQKTFDELDIEFGFPPTEKTVTPSGGFHLIYEGQFIFALGKYGFGDDIDSPNYTLIAGCSFTDGTSYKSEGSLAAAKAPQWFYDVLGKAKVKKENATETVVDLDKTTNVEWATDFLQNDAEIAVEGKGGDFQTLKIAMGVRDKGISEEMCYSLMLEFYNERCEPPWEAEALRVKVKNAYSYASQSAGGDKTAEAEFDSEDIDIESIPTFGERDIIDRQRQAREKARQREANTPTDQRQRIWTKQDVLDDWVFIADIDRFVNINDPYTPMWKRASFDAYFKYLSKGKLSEILFSQKKGTIRRFEKIGYVPGEGVSLENGKVCNLYRPSGVTPFEGDMTWWNEHIEYLFPDPEDRQHLMNWLAWFFQNPKLKPKHALLLQGRLQGTGKSFIVEMLACAIGRHNRSPVSQNDLAGNFNGYAMNTKLITIEELRAVERNSVKTALHDIITQDDISINQKNLPTFSMKNCFGVIGMTNDDAAITLDTSDRRYLVLSTPAVPRDPKYYERLYAKLSDPVAIAAFAWMLQTYDYGEYSGAGRAPDTLAKREMILSGLSELETWMLDNRNQYPLSGRVTTVQDVIDILPGRLERHGRLNAAVSSALKTHFKGIIVGQISSGNARPRAYVINGCPAFDMGGIDLVTQIYNLDRKNKSSGPDSDFEVADEEFNEGD